MRNISILIAFVSIFVSAGSVLVSAQNNLDVCRVTTDTRFKGGGTGIYEIGKFPVDSFEDGAAKSFRYKTDGRDFIIEVEVEYGYFDDVEKGTPKVIFLRLLARLSNDSSPPQSRWIESMSTYRYKWGTTQIDKAIATGETVQHFQLACSDGISKYGVKRGEPKWLRKLKSKTERKQSSPE
jgi:hypothetical protein